MDRIDCESFDSALHTFSNLLELSPDTLLRKLKVPSDEVLRVAKADFDYDCDSALWSLVGLPEVRHGMIYETCWFHASRVFSLDEFSAGIKPLGAQIEHIWEGLRSLVESFHSADEWHSFRNLVETSHTSQSADLYRDKLEDIECGWGPFAFLVLESLLSGRGNGVHDYLSIPEIIEDICVCYRETFQSTRLFRAFLNSSCSCIVKFLTREDESSRLHAVLNYLHQIILSGEMTNVHLACYCGNGNPIPPDDILHVRKLELPLSNYYQGLADV